MVVAVAARHYSTQSILVIGGIAVLGYLLIRRRAGRGQARPGDSRPQGSAPPPGSGADRWERPPVAPPSRPHPEPPPNGEADEDEDEDEESTLG